jgi:predicted nucleotidyltransferase component of viral defense system
LIEASKVRRFASEAGIPLPLAEKEIVLVYALDWLRAEGILDHLAFKGGTFLRKIVLGSEGRFSEDLDFTALSTKRTAVDLISGAVKRTHHGVRFALQDPLDNESSWGSTIEYSHSWNSGSFRLEISYREVPWLPVETREPKDQRYFRDLPFAPPKVQCLRLEEAMAEKVRATQQRCGQRDLYDLIQYSRGGTNKDLVRLLAVVKLWNNRERFDAARILEALRAGLTDWSELNQFVGRARVQNWNQECRAAAGRLAFLARHSPFERKLLDDYRRHKLKAEITKEIRRIAG